MIAFRVIEERPIVGGEKFSTVIGPAPAFRRVTRAALVLALLSLAGAVLNSGEIPRLWLSAGAVLFAAAFASAWLSGGREELVCQGGVVTYRRAGPARDQGRMLRVRELGEISPAGSDGRTGLGGIRLTSSSGALIIGRGLRADDARSLADALRQHVARVGIPHERLFVLPPQRAEIPGNLLRVRERR